MKSLWSATAPSVMPTPALSESVKVDVAIVGAGYTGLSTALHLAERGVSVCVLEANEPGWGASGRNGGQVNPTLKYDPEQLVRMLGPERAEPLISTVSNSADLVFNLIEKHGIDCAPVRKGWMQVSYSKKGVAGLHARADQWASRGVPVQRLNAAAVAARMGSEAFAGGWLDGRAGALQPLAYARGLVGAASAAGVRIHGHSAVTALQRQGAGWHLQTAGGAQVSADQVVLATNGYSGNLWPGMAQSILAANSFIVATKPLSGPAAESILPGQETVSTAQRLLLYFRKDSHGRLLMGGRGLFNDPSSPADFAHLERSLALLFPQLGPLEFEYRWAGRIAITRDFMPHVHEPAPGLTLALGCNGRGIALCTSLGQQLAGRLCDSKAEFTYPVTPLQRLPMHGLQRFYIGAGVAWYSLLDRLHIS
ncbi:MULTISPECIES: FAD-binding oxidoreductase [Pseudomonas]|uniref:NAD(P)/FAD-dependent oxidoreductase n=1 Tax=Pseudomonas TaxID=286 RepID=UPI000C8817EB|nr:MULTISPECIES: FAD-binding oxidoreductase [unclassified Pseudomonas]PMX22493.1 FAD-dependent oxidoreductase [Pseudomonas sp. GW460-12]PMX33190.1 FAD-dependent oxidoreductase [Pseudomonas sp. MPR-R2A7]PMX34761.1 FAD-dependent oxidoreductase [Pseudomonas sp. MPR-R2A4]PMX53940.1 FAD-dependent oxidoreductase [Pseudomonas sp. MPR-R2A6]PMX90756.1 FAD-dependent oxidoreductase [Pseudomonas sp. MPR-R2A3]